MERRVLRPLTHSQTKKEKETISLHLLANAPDPTNSPDPRSPATGTDDDGVGAVESDEAVEGVCYFAGDVFQY